MLDNVNSLKRLLKGKRPFSDLLIRLLNRDHIPGRPDTRIRWIYRGQGNADWGISSSLYRVVKSSDRVTEEGLGRAETAVLEEMRSQGLGHKMNDGQLLMVLQHHGIPTRLVDVSGGWLPALWFAVGHSDAEDGRLFAICQRLDANGGHPSIELGAQKNLPWEGAAIGRSYSSSAWTQSVMSVSDISLDPRMKAQRGQFLVGGLTKRYAGENWPVSGKMLPAADWPDITTLRLFFQQIGARKPAGSRWPAVAWTLRIPSNLKPEIRDFLAIRNYTAEHMYPDYDGARRLGEYVALHA